MKQHDYVVCLGIVAVVVACFACLVWYTKSRLAVFDEMIPIDVALREIDAGPLEDDECEELWDDVIRLVEDAGRWQRHLNECQNELDACKESEGVWKAMYRTCVHEKLRVKR